MHLPALNRSGDTGGRHLSQSSDSCVPSSPCHSSCRCPEAEQAVAGGHQGVAQAWWVACALSPLPGSLSLLELHACRPGNEDTCMRW